MFNILRNRGDGNRPPSLERQNRSPTRQGGQGVELQDMAQPTSRQARSSRHSSPGESTNAGARGRSAQRPTSRDPRSPSSAVRSRSTATQAPIFRPGSDRDRSRSSGHLTQPASAMVVPRQLVERQPQAGQTMMRYRQATAPASPEADERRLRQTRNLAGVLAFTSCLLTGVTACVYCVNNEGECPHFR